MKKQLTEDEKFERMQNSTWAKTMEKIFNIILLNLNFVLFSCLGVILFGVGPSLLSAYQISKEYEGSGYDSHIFSQYFKLFKKNFVVGNVLFYSTAAVGFVILNSIIYYSQLDSLYAKMGIYIMGLSAILLIFFAIISFPVFAIYPEHKMKDRFRIAIYLILINPLKMVIICGQLFLIFAGLLLFPQFILVLGFSSAVTVIYIGTKQMILKMNNKFEQQTEKEQTV